MVENNKEENSQPVIVKKHKKGHGDHHGGAWKVAYADFVTAMMAFFLVMWIVGLSDDIKQNVAAYFRDPIGYSKGGTGVLEGGQGLFENQNENSLMKSDLGGRKKEAEVWETLKEVSKKISGKLAGMQSFALFQDQIEIQLTADGLRIQLIEAGENRSFFDRGSAEMSEAGREILTAISAEISALPYQVVIEGHTDSRKFPEGAVYTNWELSADRANTARRVMLDAGMTQDRIKEIRGFAANQPRIKNDPSDPANRRIAIIVLNEYAAGDYSEVIVSSDAELQLR